MSIDILKVNRIEYTDDFVYQSDLFLRLHLVWLLNHSLIFTEIDQLATEIAFLWKSHLIYRDFNLSWKGYKTPGHVNPYAE